jgi:hypothetical protein
MKNITETIKQAITNAFATIGQGWEHGVEAAKVCKTIKTGEEAQDHTGQDVLGYFCTEESLMTTAYYEAPNLYWAWEESLSQFLGNNGLFLEPINHLEYAVYQA